MVLSESKARLQREVNDLLQQQQNQQDSLHVFHHEQDQLKKQSTYWQEYTHGLELALKEMTKQSHVYEALLTEERQRSLQVEQNLNLLQRKQYLVMNQVEEVLDIASISLNPKLQGILKQYERMASAASGGVLPSHGNALDVYQRWDFLVQVMKCKFHMYEKKILKSRSYVHKMMKVVKLYEEMLPEVEHFMTGMDSDEEEA